LPLRTGVRILTAQTKTKSKTAAKKPVKAVKKAAPKKKAPAKKAAPKTAKKAVAPTPSAIDAVLLERIKTSLDDDKAEDIVVIDMSGRSALADAIVVASGRSSRHVASIAEHLARRLKEAGYGTRPVNGAQQGDWVLVDAGDIIVHVFRPEVREYYDLESMWSVEEPQPESNKRAAPRRGRA
jgi:ribosome-associated protein